MNYFITESPQNALKNTSKFIDSDFLKILKSDHIASIIERNIPAYRERILRQL